MVAALRETSVLFAAAIAVIFLKEPVCASRIIAALHDRRRDCADPAAVSMVPKVGAGFRKDHARTKMSYDVTGLSTAMPVSAAGSRSRLSRNSPATSRIG